MAILLITHDLGVVAQVVDRVVVMYAGRIVEEGSVAAVFARPSHPYTRLLLESIPLLDGRQERLRTIPGMVPSLAQPARRLPVPSPLPRRPSRMPGARPGIVRGRARPSRRLHCRQRIPP